MFSVRKLKRGLSKTTDNVMLVTKARESVLNDIVETSEDEQYFVDTPEYTFILPDLTKFSEDFRAFLQKDLIETATLVSLEQVGQYWHLWMFIPSTAFREFRTAQLTWGQLLKI